MKTMNRAIRILPLLLLVLALAVAIRLLSSKAARRSVETRKSVEATIPEPPGTLEALPELLQTGDVLLWSNTSIDSLVIQEITDGAYSHSALILKGSRGNIRVVDTYPKAGLRIIGLDEYLSPKEFKLVRVGILRLKGGLNLPAFEKSIGGLLQHEEKIVFDNDLIWEGRNLDQIFAANEPTPVYCSELIERVLSRSMAASASLYDNDYHRVMAKWDALAAKAKKNPLSSLDFIKLYYLKLNLKKLRAHDNKTLITPGGMIRSASFDLIAEIELPNKPTDLRRHFIDLPKDTEDDAA